MGAMGFAQQDDDEDEDDRDEGRDRRHEQREEDRQRREEERQQRRERSEKAREEARRQRDEMREKMREQLQQMREDMQKQREDARRLRDEMRERHQEMRERDERDERPESAGGASASAAALAVNGPVEFRTRSRSASIEVVAGKPGQVRVQLTGTSPREIVLGGHGDRVEPRFDGRPELRRGTLHVELPPGSRVEVSSMSGDLTIDGMASARVRTMSGDVKVGHCAEADVQSISGDVAVDGASGPVRLQTVSGNAKVLSAAQAPQLWFNSASGGLEWIGSCGKGCRLSTETVSGDIQLAVDPSSSFALSFASQNGKVDAGGLSLKVTREPRQHRNWSSGGLYEATVGSGDGLIESDTFSGDLHFVRR
jgi:hypothetical protein